MSSQSFDGKGLEAVGKILALGASLSLCASVIYDWGFLRALNLSFLDVPTGIADHIRTALLWFPLGIGLVAGYLPAFMLTRRIYRNVTGDAVHQDIGANSPKKTKRSWNAALNVVALLSIVAFLFIGWLGVYMLGVGLSALWVSFAMWTYKRSSIVLNLDQSRIWAITFVPPLMLLLFCYGYISGVFAYQNQPLETLLTLSDKSDSIGVRVLRQYDKGMLVLNDKAKVVFYPWDEVKKVEMLNEFEAPKGLLCTQLSLACPSKLEVSSLKQSAK